MALLENRFPNMSIRIVLGISVAALSLSLARAPAAFGQDSMQIDLDFKSGRSRDDGIRDDGIRKDTISKPPVRKIYSRKKDGASK
jgi:pentapeptide MXKDX repeat protein